MMDVAQLPWITRVLMGKTPTPTVRLTSLDERRTREAERARVSELLSLIEQEEALYRQHPDVAHDESDR